MKLRESSIPQMYSQLLTAKRDILNLDPSSVPDVFDITFISISDYLKAVAERSKKVALVVEDIEGFYMAAVVTSHENEDPNMPGNYTYEFTFDKEDIEDAEKFSITDNNFAQLMSINGYATHGMIFNAQHFIIDMVTIVAKTLQNWLDLNASETEKVVLEHDGYFVASVEVENGEKLMSLTPSGDMKKRIKNDAKKEI